MFVHILGWNRPRRRVLPVLAGIMVILHPAAGASLTTIYGFGQADPYDLVVGPGGVIYVPQAVDGEVYSLTPPSSPGGAWTETTLFSSISNPDGLAVSAERVVYGTSREGGGRCNCGSISALTPPASPGGSWQRTVLYSFANEGDGYPQGTLAMGPGGVLYGTTPHAYGPSYGTVFSLTPPASAGGAWTFQTLHSFTGGRDGSGPSGPLAISPDGSVAGVTTHGGALGFGTAYSLVPPGSPGGDWEFKLLYSFLGGVSGTEPAGVVRGGSNVLYGSMHSGGITGGCGTVFSLTPPSTGDSWSYQTLYSFTGGADGCGPWSPLVGSGELLGTTASGGGPEPGFGTVFALTPPESPGDNWNETTLITFSGASGSGNPIAGLHFGYRGELYGVTYDTKCCSDSGTVFAVVR